MSKPFDATLKAMLEAGPADWLALAGHPGLAAEVIDADVSAVSAASDKVVKVAGRSPWLFDLNFQTGPDASLPRRVHLYNTLLHERHRLPVRSAVVLLTRDANLAAIDGRFARRFPGEPPYLSSGITSSGCGNCCPARCSAAGWRPCRWPRSARSTRTSCRAW